MAGGIVIAAGCLGDDADVLGLQAQGNDLALELVAGLLERTDVSHVISPCCFRARDHRASMAIGRPKAIGDALAGRGPSRNRDGAAKGPERSGGWRR